MLVDSTIQLIENTPLVELKNILSGEGKLYAKAEFIQPGGSVKDRAALHIIKDAYESGKLEKGRLVVEMTSGNMGAGLAVVCNLFHNPFTAVMSEGNSPARVKMLEALGAGVVLVSQVDGTPGRVTGKDIEAAIEKAVALAEEKDGFYVDQFNNLSSINAHYRGTGPEIWNDLDGDISAFVAAAGSGGTFVGTSKYLKERNSSIFCATVEPAGARVLAGYPITDPKHVIQGIGYGIQLPHWEPELVDEYLSVTNEEAVRYRELLAHKEGLFVGFSAAANVCAAVKLVECGKIGAHPKVVTVLCDTGLKY
ncbi:MAG: cysteine synthase family protein [Spirochaetes bacterium]|nr:cysteine synthase family protein [Spirochaetota bacterium]